MEIRDACTFETWEDRDGNKRNNWFKIGTAFIDGEKINLQLAAFPANGKIHIFKRKKKEETQNIDSPF